MFTVPPEQILRVEGNPLVQPPLAVALRGVQPVITYLDTVAAFGVVRSNRGRIVFLGHAMSGKTTLQRSLRRGHPIPVPRTEART